jgi:hypothetical protein
MKWKLTFIGLITVLIIPIRGVGDYTPSNTATPCSPNPGLNSQIEVPCGVLPLPDRGKNIRGASAFVEGIVQARWVGAVMVYDGTNGGASSAHIFAVGGGGNGPLYTDLGIISVAGPGGDRLAAHFAEDRLYMVNDIYLPGQPHCCPTNFVVQRFGFHGDTLDKSGDKLALEGSATITDSHDYLKAKIVPGGQSRPAVWLDLSMIKQLTGGVVNRLKENLKSHVGGHSVSMRPMRTNAFQAHLLDVGPDYWRSYRRRCGVFVARLAATR